MTRHTRTSSCTVQDPHAPYGPYLLMHGTGATSHAVPARARYSRAVCTPACARYAYHLGSSTLRRLEHRTLYSHAPPARTRYSMLQLPSLACHIHVLFVHHVARTVCICELYARQLTHHTCAVLYCSTFIIFVAMLCSITSFFITNTICVISLHVPVTGMDHSLP